MLASSDHLAATQVEKQRLTSSSKNFRDSHERLGGVVLAKCTNLQ